MTRVGFTIAFNAKHHLEQIAEMMAKTFDLWVIVEGPAKSTGSTSWCKDIKDKYMTPNFHSADGTLEYIKDLETMYASVKVMSKSVMWDGKDEMVNAALYGIQSAVNLSEHDKVFLWEIDADEIWTPESIKNAEHELTLKGLKTGQFLSDFYVGENIVATGEWGEGGLLPYNRLWDWDGSPFKSHEPPVLSTGNEPAGVLSRRFIHNAYKYRKDVEFKNDWYGGHEDILNRWDALQKEESFPQPISKLITGSWGKTKTEIIKIG